MKYADVLKKLKSLGDPQAAEGMARFGITAKEVFGVSMPDLRKLGKQIGRDHALVKQLWANPARETRILASLVADPGKFTEKDAEDWVIDFDSWEACDQCCMNLLDKQPFAYEKAVEWSKREEEFVKRAGFALMACLAWHDKKAEDEKFEPFFTAIKTGSTDERPMVKKAVNWALRQIGKRNKQLNKQAITTAKEMQKISSKPAKWVASDALRELESRKVQEKLLSS